DDDTIGGKALGDAGRTRYDEGRLRLVARTLIGGDCARRVEERARRAGQNSPLNTARSTGGHGDLVEADCLDAWAENRRATTADGSLTIELQPCRQRIGERDVG